jgi:hypothetical protein
MKKSIHHEGMKKSFRHEGHEALHFEGSVHDQSG